MSTHHHPPVWASATQREIVQRAIDSIEATERQIETATRDQWIAIRSGFVDVLEAGLRGGFAPEFEQTRPAADARLVSRHTFDDLTIENVVFRSSIGWEVNATVFRPAGSEQLPGVICPTGSSTKLNYPYWSSAQLIARSGYVVCSYDPPGFVGERSAGNDMFAYAPLGYLTGLLPRGFFVEDTRGAIDYLASRPDVEADTGFAVTGLSLGAQTTVNAAIHDPRIRFIAPVCGIMSQFDRLLAELYTVSCVDMVPDILAAGMDGPRRLSICAPLPALLVTGAGDEVVTPEITRGVYESAKRIYELLDAGEALELFIDPDVGHTYSPRMVNEVVLRLDQYLKHADSENRVCRSYTESDVIEIPQEAMLGHPYTTQNVCTLNAARAARLLSRNRDRVQHQQADLNRKHAATTLATLLGLDSRAMQSGTEAPGIVIEAPPVRSWVHDFTRITIKGNRFEVPGLLVARADSEPERAPVPGMVWIDEDGIWTRIAGQGYLARAFRFLERDRHPAEPVVLAIDAAGFGTQAHRYSAYDATSWSDPDSTLAYLGIAVGTPVAGLRVRDALAALSVLAANPWVDPDRMIIAGVGEGAVTALLASVVSGRNLRTILVEPPVSYEAVVSSGDHRWKRSSFVPRLLEHFDLPDLIRLLGSDSRPSPEAMPATVTVIDPLDAMKKPIPRETVTRYLPESDHVSILIAADVDPRQAFVDTVLAPWDNEI